MSNLRGGCSNVTRLFIGLLAPARPPHNQLGDEVGCRVIRLAGKRLCGKCLSFTRSEILGDETTVLGYLPR
jgi:hypothetical protein